MSTSDTKLDVQIGSNAINNDIATLNTAVWYHVAVTWDNGSYAIYLDGSRIKSGSTNFAGLNTIANVGNYYSPSLAMDGMADEVLIYNKGLSSGQVLQLFQMF